MDSENVLSFEKIDVFHFARSPVLRNYVKIFHCIVLLETMVMHFFSVHQVLVNYENEVYGR